MITRSAAELKLKTFQSLVLGELVRVPAVLETDTIGIVIEAAPAIRAILFLTGEHPFEYYQYRDDKVFLSIAMPAELQFQFEDNQPQLADYTRRGALVVTSGGALIAAQSNMSQFPDTVYFSASDWKQTDFREPHGTFMAVENWSLGTVRPGHEFDQWFSRKTP